MKKENGSLQEPLLRKICGSQESDPMPQWIKNECTDRSTMYSIFQKILATYAKNFNQLDCYSNRLYGLNEIGNTYIPNCSKQIYMQ